MDGKNRFFVPDIGFGLLGLIGGIIGVLVGFAATSAEFRIGIVFLFVLGGLNSVLAGKPWSGFGWFLYGVGFLLGFYLLGRWGMLGGLLVACLIATPIINLYEHEMELLSNVVDR